MHHIVPEWITASQADSLPPLALTNCKTACPEINQQSMNKKIPELAASFEENDVGTRYYTKSSAWEIISRKLIDNRWIFN